MMNCFGQLNPSDSIKKVSVTRGALSRLYSAAIQRDILAEKIGLLIADTALLNKRIFSKQEQILLLESIHEHNQNIIKAMKVQLDLLNDEKLVFKEQLNSYEKLLRKEKRKRFLVSVAGILTTGITSYLLLKK